jgi:hypothetical protein
MLRLPRLTITDDLCIRIGESAVQISPSHGLRIAETLARKSFRRALSEEAETPVGKPTPKRRTA